jgi:hypothetical protein
MTRRWTLRDLTAFDLLLTRGVTDSSGIRLDSTAPDREVLRS